MSKILKTGNGKKCDVKITYETIVGEIYYRGILITS